MALRGDDCSLRPSYPVPVVSEQAVPASVSAMEISSALLKAPGMGGGGCVYKDAGDKQKIGRQEGWIVNTSFLHFI